MEDGTTKAEVYEAVGAALGDVNPAQIEVKSLRKGPRGTQVALVLAPRAIASAKILKPGKVRVGWVFARAREKRMVPRCFKCLEYGHIAIECPKEEVTESLCLRCGEPGHLVATCKGQEKCVPCEAAGRPHEHRTGDASCEVLREARRKLESRARQNG